MINNVDSGKYDSYNDFRFIENNISQILGTSFAQKQKYTYLIFCYINEF